MRSGLRDALIETPFRVMEERSSSMSFSSSLTKGVDLMRLRPRSLELHTRLPDFVKRRPSRSGVGAFETEFRFFSWTAVHLDGRDLCQYHNHRAGGLGLTQLSNSQQKSIEFQARLAPHPVAQRSSRRFYDPSLSPFAASHVLLLQHQQALNQRQSRYHRRRPHSVKWGHLKVRSKGCLDRGNHITYLESRLISS